MPLAQAQPAKRPSRVRKSSPRLARIAGQFAQMTVAERTAYVTARPDLAAKALGSLAASVLSQVK